MKKPDFTDYLDSSNPKGHGSNAGHNEKCFYQSDNCSKEMYNFDICFWHYVRMGTLETIKCNCGKKWNVICGDAIGRIILKQYCNMSAKIPVCDTIGNIYCCSVCQNTDNYISNCGVMRVCEECSNLHQLKN